MAVKKNITKEYAAALYQITAGKTGAELTEALSAFAALLARKGLLKRADKIMQEFIALSKQKEGIVDIEITSMNVLPENIIKKIEAAFGKTVVSTNKTDKSLLGGMIIKTNDKIFDASLKTQLSRLKQQLI